MDGDTTTTTAKADPPPPQLPSKHSIIPKYKHTLAIHYKARPSCLSHDRETTPSFIGFRNLMVLVLIAGNLRLVVENYMKYGVLIGFSPGSFRPGDVRLGLLCYLTVPCHLYIAYLIELTAAAQARSAQATQKKTDESKPVKLRVRWRLIAFAHALNATLCLSMTSAAVYWNIDHPLIGTLCETHAIIVWLKLLSYAFTNRDLRDSFLENHPVPEVYAACPYPQNITLGNLTYFWWAPTLVYQPVYPRSPSFRMSFFLKRFGEMIGLSVAIWFLTQQYAVPTLRNSVIAMDRLNLAHILERLMKLSTISTVVWLCGFCAVFQSGLNALAEVMRFGDREFYSDWWNSASLGGYWRTWNRPVYQFMKRHIYAPLRGRGWRHGPASTMVFLFSAVLHEMLVGLPTKNVIGIAFVGMMAQLPLIAVTLPLEKMHGSAQTIGNMIFWTSFCLIGQPFAALCYFFAYSLRNQGVRPPV
ncbi:hypothetical protein TWF696_008379 [Orbilia brochopaga]|uniref:O-acyltransferase n=1 Tax=Orbilia brochopaga TaxID=3140254 RepID=A0AAV9UFM8_9PEZI